MGKISDASIPLDHYRPGIAGYSPPISRRHGNFFRKLAKPLPPQPAPGNRYLCRMEVVSSPGSKALRITIPSTKSCIGIEIVPEWDDEIERTFPFALFYCTAETGPREFEFPGNAALLVKGSEISITLAEAVITRDDLEMHAVLMEKGAWRLHPIHGESIRELQRGCEGFAFVCRGGSFTREEISKIEVFG